MIDYSFVENLPDKWTKEQWMLFKCNVIAQEYLGQIIATIFSSHPYFFYPPQEKELDIEWENGHIKKLGIKTKGT